MTVQRKQSIAPSILGCIISILLAVSFVLTRLKTLSAFNTVLIIVILCMSVHLVRITCALYFPHVWKSVPFSVLLLIPVTYLLVTAAQFIRSNATFFGSAVFNVFLILISLPMFCCYYFSVLSFFYKGKHSLKVMTVIIDVAGAVYCFVRLADKIFIPLASNGTNDLSVVGEVYDVISPYFSLCIYVLAFVNFIIWAKYFGGTQKNGELPERSN